MKSRTDVFILMLLLLAGCGHNGGGVAIAPNENDLGQIYSMYQRCVKNTEKPPSGTEDLERYEPIFPAAFRRLKDGKYLVVWNVTSKDPGTILAYEKDVPINGGVVLMADGAVKTMTAEQFKAAGPGS